MSEQTMMESQHQPAMLQQQQTPVVGSNFILVPMKNETSQINNPYPKLNSKVMLGLSITNIILWSFSAILEVFLKKISNKRLMLHNFNIFIQ